MIIPVRVMERVIERVQHVGECWISAYSTGSHGYAQVGWTEGGVRFMTLAHRVAYIAAYGSIPDGLTVDHVCRVRRCVNPAHLRLLSNVENARLNGNAIKTHCPSGHPYDDENTYIEPSCGHRRCRACVPAQRARFKARQRAA